MTLFLHVISNDGSSQDPVKLYSALMRWQNEAETLSLSVCRRQSDVILTKCRLAAASFVA